MAVFRLQENVPDVYARKSRDFQLLCNVFDCVNNGVKYDIDSIVDIVDTKQCNERLLPLLQTKLGFFSKKDFTASQLRAALMSFKQIVKDKGSELGIREAIEVFLKISNASNKSDIRRVNIDTTVDDDLVSTRLVNNYIVTVAIESKVIDVSILTELLRYVLPAGYQLRYSFYSSAEQIDVIMEKDILDIIFLNTVGSNDGTVLGNNRVAAKLDEKKYQGYTGVNGVSTSHSVLRNTEPSTEGPKFVTGFIKEQEDEAGEESTDE